MTRLPAFAALVPVLATLAGMAFGQSAVDTRDAEAVKGELDRVRASISISEQRAAELKSEIRQMGDDRAQLSAELIAAAQRLAIGEIQVTDAEDRLLALRAEESRIKNRLDSEDRGIYELVAAMQRIGRSPPPALIVNPADALSSARSAMLLGAVLPQLRQRATEVLTDLKALEQVRQSAEAESSELRANYATLSEERLRIATLIEARRQGLERAGEALAAEQARAEQLAARAGSLDELIADMQSQIAAVQAAAAAARAADEAPPVLPPATGDDDPIRLAFANTDRSEPAVPFRQAKGHLQLPVTGVRVLDFGAQDGFGGISQGISIVTRAQAQVVAPADGWVVYTGPYLNYGQIVILNAGLGYNILLAGLDNTSVELGQFVLMGEPVGQMGSQTLAQTVATSAGMSRPTLYIEFRSDGRPIDPSAWWASEPTETLEG